MTFISWQISQWVNAEVILFFKSVQLGMILTFWYDVIRIFRKIMLHNNLAVFMEDVLFLAYAGYRTVWLLLVYNYGGFRLYVLAGFIIGAVLYKSTIGNLFFAYTTKCLLCIKTKLQKLFYFVKMQIKKPCHRLYIRYQTYNQWIQRKRSLKVKKLKKKLTQIRKLIKIILCKQ